MKISEQWLREWINPDVSTETLATQLTSAGLEVGSVEPVAGDLDGVVVGEVIAAVPHPDADRLRVCEVSVGKGDPLSIVCGASNARAGLRAPVAVVGAQLAGGAEIERATLRGATSEGMLCSEAELGLSEEAEGLMELPPDAPVGQNFVDYLDLRDSSIEIELTPNRGDCLSIQGIAREVGVLNRTATAVPAIAPVLNTIEDDFPVVLEAPAQCSRYVGRVIRNIDPNATTPLWMRERLRRCGLRSIGPVVDVTNYVMLELGQPMHAFDFDKLNGRIRVRLGQDGETLTLLDGQELTLDPSALVIADDKGALALAGIMGGIESGVSETTRNVFLESAFFEPVALAGEARRYGLHTDASHRFERGVDPDLQRRAAERATALLLDVVGGEAGPIIDVSDEAHVPTRAGVRLRSARIQRLLGIEVPSDQVSDVLSRLGMELSDEGGAWVVTPPSFRFDIQIEADLIEELVRIIGYDNVPSRQPYARLGLASRPEALAPLTEFRQCLVERGYWETISYSFVDPKLRALIDPGREGISLANPISADMAVMRTSLWPGLVQAVLYNTKRQHGRVRAFESGLSFRRDPDLVQERTLAGAAIGSALPEQWGLPRRSVDFFDIKSDVEALLEVAGAAHEYQFQAAEDACLHPGQAAVISRNGRPIGRLGALHPRIARQLKLSGSLYLFELQLAVIERGNVPKFEELSKYPGVRRDLALVVEESVSARAVHDCVGQVTDDVLQNLELFDVYRGESIDSGKKSFALGLTFQASSRTLNDEEVDALVAKIVDHLRRNLGAELRG